YDYPSRTITTMKRKTAIELSIPSKLGFEKVARSVAASVGQKLCFDSERIADLQTAVGEACLNAIEHGNQCRPDLRISVRFLITTRRLEVVVADNGVCDKPLPPSDYAP